MRQYLQLALAGIKKMSNYNENEVLVNSKCQTNFITEYINKHELLVMAGFNDILAQKLVIY